MATSGVDETFPADNEKVSKAEMRAQFLVIKNELEDLMARTSLAGAQAFGLTSASDVEQMIQNNNTLTKVSYARNIAYGVISL